MVPELNPMKRLKLVATITALLGLLAMISVIYLFYELVRVSADNLATQNELYVAGGCLIAISLFIISAFVTLGYLLKTSDRMINLTTDTDLNKKHHYNENVSDNSE